LAWLRMIVILVTNDAGDQFPSGVRKV
jgi:hypothetical protein